MEPFSADLETAAVTLLMLRKKQRQKQSVKQVGWLLPKVGSEVVVCIWAENWLELVNTHYSALRTVFNLPFSPNMIGLTTDLVASIIIIILICSEGLSEP